MAFPWQAWFPAGTVISVLIPSARQVRVLRLRPPAPPGGASRTRPVRQRQQRKPPRRLPATDILGTWQRNPLHIAAAANHPEINLRIVNKITKNDKGELKVLEYSIDQGGQAMASTRPLCEWLV